MEDRTASCGPASYPADMPNDASPPEPRANGGDRDQRTPSHGARPRRRSRAWLALVALPVLSLALGVAGCGATGGAGPEARALLAAVNEARAAARDCGGVRYPAAPALVLEPRLTRAAASHSEDMRAHGSMSHTGSDGSSVAQRVEREGYRFAALGENVAWGYPTTEAVMAGWLGSPGHCANIMNAAFEELGAGVAGTYWTLDLAAPR